MIDYATLAVALLALSLPGCSSGTLPSMTLADEQRALAINDEYKTYGRVDDELRWAPFLCRMPLPGIPRQSASRDAATHGRCRAREVLREQEGVEGTGDGQGAERQLTGLAQRQTVNRKGQEGPDRGAGCPAHEQPSRSGQSLSCQHKGHAVG